MPAKISKFQSGDKMSVQPVQIILRNAFNFFIIE